MIFEKVINDGVIKYDRNNFTYHPPLSKNKIKTIEYWRKKLRKLNLIGFDLKSKIGHGNISQRYNQKEFIISGTQTGRLLDLKGVHYTSITDYNIEEFKIYTKGPIEASSEALTHAAIYEANDQIKAIIHIHSTSIWNKLLELNLYIDEHVEYGTKEMAMLSKSFAQKSNPNIFAMKGHQDGVIAYGKNFKEAYELIYKYYKSNPRNADRK